jgi:DNA-binding transcriptional LysR family regulator
MGDIMQIKDRIGRHLKLQDLNILMTVAQAGSMGKAAERLNSSQPSVSRSITELEHSLGVTLFDRHRRGIEPTEHGRALLNCGGAVFDELRQGIQNIEFLSDPAAGEVRVGCNPFLAVSFVSVVVNLLSQTHPRIVFRLVTAPSESLLRELGERNVDLLIIRKLGPLADKRMSFQNLFDDSYVIAAGAQSALARRRRLTFAELAGESWVLPPPDTVIGAVAQEAFRTHALGYPRTAVVATPLELRISLLAKGNFLTILPASALQLPTRRPEIKALPLELPIARVPNGIVTMTNRALTPVARSFVEKCREVAKTLARAQ